MGQSSATRRRGLSPAGRATQFKCMMAVRYQELTLDGAQLHEVDVDNMIRIVNGTGRLAE